MIMHHPRYFVFIERAQQAWMESVLGAPRFDWRNFPDMYLVVRKLEAEYLVPIEGVRDITVVLWPAEIKAAKLLMEFEIRSPDLKVLYCRGQRLNCKVDRESHRPVFWSDEFLELGAKEIEIARTARL
jgi:acyl-CoA thioesterase FadM